MSQLTALMRGGGGGGGTMQIFFFFIFLMPALCNQVNTANVGP